MIQVVGDSARGDEFALVRLTVDGVTLTDSMTTAVFVPLPPGEYRDLTGVYDLTVAGELSLHGVVKPITLPVHVEVRGDSLTATGKLAVKQTDYGIEPTTAAGGLVKVENEVALSFRIEARAAQ